MKKRRLTPTQKTILENLYRTRGLPVSGPRDSLERLHKKGLVEGNRREGWRISPSGLRWLAS